MRRTRSLPWSPFIAALVVSFVLVARPVDAGSGMLALGEVVAGVVRPEFDVDKAFRSAVVREVDRVNTRGLPKAGRYVVSARLVRMETRRTGRNARTLCVVSATLRQKRGGALLAMVSGRADVENPRGRDAATEVRALRAAVRGAFKRIPEALER